MHDDDVNDDDVLGALRHGLSKLPVPQPPPLEGIVARGRARRRRSGLAGISLAAAGLAIALPAIITGVNGPSGRVATSLRLGSRPVHLNLAAYSVDSNPNGTVSVALATKGNFDPNKLRQALARAGVAAVVNVDAFCQTPVQPGGFRQVVVPLHGSAASSAAGAGRSAPQGNVTAMVIKPSAMPRRAELSIGYFPDHVAMTLVKLGGPLSCAANDPAGCNVPVAVPAGNGSSSSQAATSTTLPSATATTAAPATTTTLAQAATTTVPPGATSTSPASATTSLPAGASSGAAQRSLGCAPPSPVGTGDTSGTSGGATTTVASSSTTSAAL